LKATVRKVRTLTGEILYPKPTGFRPQRIFQNGFPNYKAFSPKRHCQSSMGLCLSPFAWRRYPVNAIVPNGGKAIPNGPADALNYSAIFPISPQIFLNFPAIFPNASPAAIICNGLFPSNLCGFQAFNRQILN
jgi:hypothetical protein